MRHGLLVLAPVALLAAGCLGAGRAGSDDTSTVDTASADDVAVDDVVAVLDTAAADDTAIPDAFAAGTLPREGVWSFRFAKTGPFQLDRLRVEVVVSTAGGVPTLSCEGRSTAEGWEDVVIFSVEGAPISSGGVVFEAPVYGVGAVEVALDFPATDFACGTLTSHAPESNGVTTTLAGRHGELPYDEPPLPRSCDDVVCLGPEASRTCANRCEHDSQCPADALCNPVERAVRGIVYPTGVCAPIEGCVPGGEAQTCDDPASGCTLVDRGSVCVAAGTAGPDAPCDEALGEAGARCATGLACAFGRCRRPCDGGCEGGASCVSWVDELPLGAAELALCLPLCDPIAQTGCAAGDHCAPRAGVGQRLVALCEEGTGGSVGPGEVCETSTACAPGYVCGGECWGLCTLDDVSRCTIASSCRADEAISWRMGPAPIAPWPGYGTCAGDCVALSPGDCDAGATCGELEVFRNLAGEEVAVGRCGAATLAAEGEDCGPGRPFGCGADLLCGVTGHIPTPRVCERACRLDGSGGATCHADEACVPYVEDATVWGTCRPIPGPP